MDIKAALAKAARDVLEGAIEEVRDLQDEPRPDVEMLRDLRNDVYAIAQRESDETLVTVAERLLDEIDALLVRAERLADVANDKSADEGQPDHEKPDEADEDEPGEGKKARPKKAVGAHLIYA